MEEKNGVILFEQDKIMSKVSNSLRIANQLLPIKSEPELIPYRKGNKWGFCTPDKKIVIGCVYERVYRFTEGIARVKSNRGYGFIDLKGNHITEIKYLWAYEFKEGFAGVYSKNNGWSFINKQGDIVFDFKDYDDIYNFHNGFAGVVKNGKLGFINNKGFLIIPNIYDHDYLTKKNYDDREFFYCSYKFSEGLISLSLNEKFGVLDTEGNIIIPFKYEYIGDYSNGLVVCVENTNLIDKYTGGYTLNRLNRGYLDKKGELKIPTIYDSNYNWRDFSEGLALVKSEYDKFFINEDNEIVIPYNQNYNFFGKFSEGLCPIYVKRGIRENNKKGYINKKGDIVIEPIFDDVYDFSEGLAMVRIYGLGLGFINTSGKLVIECKYINLINQKFKNGIVSMNQNQKYGYMNRDGIEYWED
jgi:hypothetical protein